MLGRLLARSGGKEHEKAIAVLSMMVGALTLSRAVNDPDLARAILEVAAEQVRVTADT